MPIDLSGHSLESTDHRAAPADHLLDDLLHRSRGQRHDHRHHQIQYASTYADELLPAQLGRLRSDDAHVQSAHRNAGDLRASLAAADGLLSTAKCLGGVLHVVVDIDYSSVYVRALPRHRSSDPLSSADAFSSRAEYHRDHLARFARLQPSDRTHLRDRLNHPR